ncbi:salicylic acid-binding protein 2-like [Tasmannia lanceolata]|uniref:salicylic acid-binding protein 2-like n=1 Tax=Tasmannia lanceolata TaxID=3420 RepID=UPI0040630796
MEENREKMEEVSMEDFVNHNVLVHGAPHGTWENSDKKKHFVLVHGAGHGAWGWYKVATMLESAGYQVTKVAMAASGINMTQFSEVKTFADYTAPLLVLMASLHSEDRVILVGQSFGGMNIALAMERFPEKVLCGVFVNAFMPDCTNQPSYVLTEYGKWFPPPDFYMDSEFKFDDGPTKPPTSIEFGAEFLKAKLYQHSPLEDYILALMLVRITSFFEEDLLTVAKFSEERYGSIPRVYISGTEDEEIPPEFQSWMMRNFSVKEHEKLYESLVGIAQKYS